MKLADTTFHIPDVAGVGISVRPIPVLTINADAVHVKYSNLDDDFVSTTLGIRDVNGYKAPDVTELHLGGEYFFSTKIPFALRGGVWRDPAHSIEWRGPLDQFEGVAAALLYPKGESQTHAPSAPASPGRASRSTPRTTRSKHYKVGSISVVTRFSTRAAMEFDIFFSICQTEVDGYLPDEQTMFENFFEQVELADRLGFGTAWVAESHLSTEVQKTNPGAVIPHFVGEIGLNTDILQLAHRVFARTKRIGVGSRDPEHPLQRRPDRARGADQDVPRAARARSARSSAC